MRDDGTLCADCKREYPDELTAPTPRTPAPDLVTFVNRALRQSPQKRHVLSELILVPAILRAWAGRN
ncbi:MAG: hypothetical protein PHS14_04900 [Elusimicrobia bacterium]|nr:hypothetical protein [Elusimicrobiota bacterium]